MKLVIFFIFIAVIFVVIGGYFLIDANPQILEDAKKNIGGSVEKIVIANIGEYSIFNLIADKNGYFKNNNLEVQIIEYPSGPPAIVDLLARKVDFAVAADFVGVRNIFTNDDLRILAEVSKHEDFQIVARMDKGILSSADLKGKKIGVTRKGVGEFFLGRFLTFNNIYLKDVSTIDLQPAEIVKQLESGQIDAAVVFNPHVYAIQKMLGDKVMIGPVQGGQKVFALLYSLNSFIKDHPDVAERYIRSLVEAEGFLRENDAQARKILIDAMGYEATYVDYIWPKFDFTISLEQALLLSMEDQASFAMENKLTDSTQIPNYLNHIYLDALQKNNPKRISIIR